MSESNICGHTSSAYSTHPTGNESQSLGKLAHNVQRFDVQPSVDPNNLVIFVVGQVKVG